MPHQAAYVVTSFNAATPSFVEINCVCLSIESAKQYVEANAEDDGQWEQPHVGEWVLIESINDVHWVINRVELVDGDDETRTEEEYDERLLRPLSEKEAIESEEKAIIERIWEEDAIKLELSEDDQ